MNIPISIRIAISMFGDELDDIDSLENRLRHAMKRVRDTNGPGFMCASDDEQFRSAVGAVMFSYGQGSEEFARLEQEMKLLQAFSASTSGIPVDFDQLLNGNEEPVGLMKIWNEGARGDE